MEDVIVLGSGPAGLTAALYAGRADLEPLVITGNDIGGQISITNEVENYPGFPEGATGPELVELMKEHAERFGARLVVDVATEVELEERPLRVRTDRGDEYETKALIIATGASPRKLKVPGEQEYTGRGVSYCATCDGFFFRDKKVIVVGGGDSAMEEGVFLTKFASEVNVVHRRDELRAGPTLAKRARGNDKVKFIWDTVVTEINGNDAVHSVHLKNVETGEERDFDTDGVFIYIGHIPNSDLFAGQLEMDSHGYLITDERTRTKIPGVFAAGEITDPIFRQIATSVGMGCRAAMQAEKYLAELEDEEPSEESRSLASW